MSSLDKNTVGDPTEPHEACRIALFEQIELAVLGINAEGRIDYANPFFCRVTGLKSVEIIGRPIVDYLPERFREEFLRRFSEAIDKHPRTHSEWPVLCSGGYERVFAWSSVRYQDSGSKPLIMTIGEDITDRKAAEEQLRKEKALTEAVFDAAPGMIYLYTMEGQLIRWNKKHVELTGYSDEELANFKAADWFEGEDLAIMTREWKKVFTEGYSSAELHLKIKDGTKVPFLFNGVKVEINGKPHLVGMGVCLTEFRETQEQLAETTAQLAHVSRIGIMGELASALAHELNQPLAAILSNAQAGRRFLAAGGAKAEEMNAIFDDIIADDKRAGDVIRNLRAMVHKGPVERENCSVNDLIRDTVTILNTQLVSAKTQVFLELCEKLPEIKIGRVEIQQVIINLILNACQAMAEIPENERRITLLTSLSTEAIQVSVQDNGHGIPKETLPGIFEPFVTTKKSGLGMGLAICRRLIDSHGGWIRAENHPGGGAQFTFSLPLFLNERSAAHG